MPALLTEVVIMKTTKPSYQIEQLCKKGLIYQRPYWHYFWVFFFECVAPSREHISLLHPMFTSKHSTTSHLPTSSFDLWHGLKHWSWHESQSGQWSVTSRPTLIWLNLTWVSVWTLICHIKAHSQYAKHCSQLLFQYRLKSWLLITFCASLVGMKYLLAAELTQLLETFLCLILLVQKDPFLKATIYFSNNSL